MSSTERQFCAICAWRENCAKKFCVSDGGARCPDYSRDISIKYRDASQPEEKADEQHREGDR
ncbi:hypothetical protein [Geobacter sp. DSM 9736]|uniref:hypothetical protein n=1 Tax=Geobacter sp. DSM 9736 TaxID=1277350 RepID=UPI000B5116DB|nr:hypothetical protein [Geobacter sp. DSM 9736]